MTFSLAAQNKSGFRVFGGYRPSILVPRVGLSWNIPIYSGCNPASRPVPRSILDSLALDLASMDSFTFAIEYYNDCRADSTFNRAYTQRHADTLATYLNRKAGNRLALTAIGFGEDSLVNDCRCEKYGSLCSEEEHVKNRRMVVRITGMRREN